MKLCFSVIERRVGYSDKEAHVKSLVMFTFNCTVPPPTPCFTLLVFSMSVLTDVTCHFVVNSLLSKSKIIGGEAKRISNSWSSFIPE